ncbi:putative spore protein YtfJ [Kitasatospora gansuensis]|uniref:Putative spore protein YtfJ n=1 Tax=Kitasatospora gansuensis TaxID=258050 RepID=A0A7W7WIP4_9ACTN|nr:hypothetical protein [Kitasatospora gansuensis]MBB4948403.1 putative spore protein YtfJ [Kitasatospora gansuensis]
MKATTAPTSPPASLVEPTSPALLPILAAGCGCGGGCGCGCQSGAPCQCGGASGGCCGGH